MKTKSYHNSPQYATAPTFKPHALTMTEQNAIDLLITGKSDGEVGEALGLDRGTIWRYRHRNPIFMAELERRRAEIWRAPQERLRSLVSKAVENIAALVETGNYDASIDLLKITGMHGGLVNFIGEQDPAKLIEQEIDARIKAEDIPKTEHESMSMMLDLKTGKYQQRKAEIEAELIQEFGEPDQ
jgi:DNA-binding CsgD family transcriptional regulator